MLKSLAWDDIRIERFPLTPPGVFTELVRNAERPGFKNRAVEWLRRNFANVNG